MSGFDAAWLGLREPADRAARAWPLVEALSRHLAAHPAPRLLDIGCGTGSTWRSLVGHLPAHTGWRLLDHDPLLLEQARQRIGSETGVEIAAFDLNAFEALDCADFAVVSASALFDLCSASFCGRVVAHLARHRVGLYAALNYDGVMHWSVGHPLDEEVVADFNRHQTGDKGFGPALGPAATDHLRTAFERHGYAIAVAESPWLLGPEDRALQEAFLDGVMQPLAEIGRLPSGDVLAWRRFRSRVLGQPGSLCRVGHLDLLALPPQ